jgi:hypothetical protein
MWTRYLSRTCVVSGPGTPMSAGWPSRTVISVGRAQVRPFFSFQGYEVRDPVIRHPMVDDARMPTVAASLMQINPFDTLRVATP